MAAWLSCREADVNRVESTTGAVAVGVGGSCSRQLSLMPVPHSSPWLRFQSPLIGRVGIWRAAGRVRWMFRRFRSGPQSGSRRHVSSSRLVSRVENWRAAGRVRWMLRRFRSGPQSGSRRHVSSSRLVKPSVPLYGTGLSCWLRPKVYVTVRAGSAFGRSPRLLHLFRPNPSRLVSLPLEIKSPSQVFHRWTSLSSRPCLPCCRRPASSRAPSLHGNYPASTLLLAHPPPSRLRPTSRCCRL